MTEDGGTIPVFSPSFTSRLIYRLYSAVAGERGGIIARLDTRHHPRPAFPHAEITANNTGTKTRGGGPDRRGMAGHYRIVSWEAAKSPIQGDNYTW